MRTASLLLLTTILLPAQFPIGANALRWNGTTSTAGPLCWGFSCIPDTATLVAGENGSLLIRGNYLDPYVLGTSLSATQCTSVPFINNQLVLDNPITIFWTGILNTLSPALVCPSGSDTLAISIPINWPSNLTFTIQGLTGTPFPPGPAEASFTQPITFVVL